MSYKSLQVPDNYPKKHHLVVLSAHYIWPSREQKRLSQYYSGTYFRIADTSYSVGGAYISDGILTNMQNNPNFESFFPSNFDWCSYLTTGSFCNISKKNTMFHFVLLL